MQLSVEGKGLQKVFNRRVIFRDVSFALSEGQTLLISGRNGSGKSTLVKIICQVLTPTRGNIAIRVGTVRVTDHATACVGLVAPYLQMYDEFSARENLRYAMAIRGMHAEGDRISSLLHRVNLSGREDDPVRAYSSGMKQRVKYAFALVHRPAVLVLDEPMANLDADGVQMVRSVMEEHRRNGILIVATNDLTDIDRFDHQIDLNVSA